MSCTQTASISVGQSKSMNSNNFPSSTLCWYKFYPSSYRTDFIKIIINDLINATAEVYYEYDTNKYLYKSSLSKNQSVNIEVNSYYSVWILAVPTSNNGYISVTGTADNYPSFSLDIDTTILL